MMQLARWFVERKCKAIEDIDPQRFYVENVRAVFGLPQPVVRRLLDLAVREGVLERRIGVLCPHEAHMVAWYTSEDMIPKDISCDICEMEGREDHRHSGDEMDRLPFYRLVSDD